MSYPWQLALGLNTPTTVTTPNGRIYMPDPANLDIYGGNPNDILQTDGAGGLRWTSMQAGTSVEWDSILNKPLTFPPTVPIAWADVAHPATFPPELPIPISGVSGLQAALDAKATLPIAQSDVTNLVADLALKAPLASPIFTGDPRAPTPALNDNDTSIATTQWVKSLGFSTGNQAITISGDASGTGATTIPLTVSGLQGKPIAPTAPLQDQVLQWNGTAWTPTLLNLTGGTITAVTAGTGLSGGGTSGPVTLNIAASGVTNGLLANMPGLTIKGNANGGSSVPADLTVLQVMTLLGAAPLASPLFTGDPRAPHPAPGDDDTSIATTAWVKALGYGGGSITALTGDVTASGSGAVPATVTALQGRAVFNTAPADNQVLQWSLANNRWQPGTVAGAGTVTSISAGSGITVSPSPITGAGTVSLTVPVGVANGGTGLTTIASNAMLVGNGTAALQVITPGGNGAIWASNGAATPSYRPLSNLIDVMTGGGATGQILHRTSIGFWGALAPGTAGQVLKSGGPSANVAWGALDAATGLTGVLPVANGGSGAASLAAGPWVTRSGDTMTGTLAIQPASGDASIGLRKSAGANNSYIAGQVGTLNRWTLNLADGTSETGSNNTGSNFVISRFADNGNGIDAPLSISRATGNATFTGELSVNNASHSRLMLNKGASGNTAAIYGQRAGVTRWSLELGSVANETGSGNSGSDLVIGRFADNGSWIDNPLTIWRTSGDVVLSRNLTLSGTYLYLANGTGAANAAGGGPFIYADANAMVFHLGQGTSPAAFWFQNKDGGAVGGFTAGGWVCGLGNRQCITNDGTYTMVANNAGTPAIYLGSSGNYAIIRNDDGIALQNMAGANFILLRPGSAVTEFYNTSGGYGLSLRIGASAYTAVPSIRTDAGGNLVLNASDGGLIYLNWDNSTGKYIQIGGRGFSTPQVAYGSQNAFGFGWATYPGFGASVAVSVDNGGAAYPIASASDRRMKGDIAPTRFDCLDAVLRMPVREFRWRKFTDPWALTDARLPEGGVLVRAGVVAQEINEIFPEGVQEGDDFEDHLGRVWTLEHNTMIAALIGAIQQLNDKVQTLEARLH